tara:strand:+ start:2466 stop:3026 length:561 start_codon:yes stop_codon:yes gene_type:complete
MKTIKSLSIILLLSSFIISAQKVDLNVEKSNVKWAGKKITNSSHSGSLKFKSGSVTFSGDLIETGKFIVDMTTINVEDLAGKSKARLEGHLKSDDFFSTEEFTESTLEINSSTKDGDLLKVSGNLTIKGISSPVEFEMKKDGDNWLSSLTFDRSKHNVRFGSGSFFENLGDKLILDEIELEVTLSF